MEESQFENPPKNKKSQHRTTEFSHAFTKPNSHHHYAGRFKQNKKRSYRKGRLTNMEESSGNDK